MSRGPVAIPTRSRERGVVLIMVLIGIVAMALAGIALMRASQTGSMVAGNCAFKETAVAAGDTGVELAFAQLGTITTSLPDLPYPVGCNVGTNCVYYPTRQAVDVNGVPTIVGDWSGIPSNTVGGGYATKYVIDRLCAIAPPVSPATFCYVGSATGAGGSRKVGDTNFSSVPQIYYRISVQVSGPRNTTSFVQAIVAK